MKEHPPGRNDGMMRPLPLLPAFALLALPLISPAGEVADLKADLVLAASFDYGLNADFAAGDPVLYHAPNAARSTQVPGLPAGGLVRHETTGGQRGGALVFTKKMRPVVFFQGDGNIAYRPANWSGTCSFWLKLDPDKDLEPGYCDPLQLVGQSWDEGHMFAEFSKDHTPRRFRFAIRPVKALWNPDNLKWEESPEKPRLMAETVTPPFRSDRWTHVVMTFAGVNSKGAEAEGALYLDGREVGRFRREQLFNWEPDRSALTLGLSYVGGFDELLMFRRALTPAEVQALHAAGGVLPLKKPGT